MKTVRGKSTTQHFYSGPENTLRTVRYRSEKNPAQYSQLVEEPARQQRLTECSRQLRIARQAKAIARHVVLPVGLALAVMYLGYALAILMY